jgi:hypothetical protein
VSESDRDGLEQPARTEAVVAEPAVAGFRLVEFVPVVIGFGALVAGTLAGWDGRFLDALAHLPVVVRFALGAASLIGAALLLGAAVERMEARAPGSNHLVEMLRGIRLAFLALAALSVAAGWLLGQPLPFVVALIIAGIDIVETSFLLLVVRRAPSTGD